MLDLGISRAVAVVLLTEIVFENAHTSLEAFHHSHEAIRNGQSHLAIYDCKAQHLAEAVGERAVGAVEGCVNRT